MFYSSPSSSSSSPPPSSSLFSPPSSAPASASLSPLGVGWGAGGGTGWWPPSPPLWTNVHNALLLSVVCFCKVKPFRRRTPRTTCGPSWQRTPSVWSDNLSLEIFSCKVRIYEKIKSSNSN